MKGFSFLECLVATVFFLTILLVGYQFLDQEGKLLREALQRSGPEAESGYRMLLLQELIRNCSTGFRTDPILEETPFFFTDLSFGAEQRPDAFSIACSAGSHGNFIREGTLYRSSPLPALSPGRIVVLAGSDSTGEFGWNYARVLQVKSSSTEQRLQLSVLIAKPLLDSGTMMEVELHGFQFRKSTLYWISPGGLSAPFLGPLEQFQYCWNAPLLSVSWKTRMTSTQFATAL